MSLIGQVSGIPLFTTIHEATAWARANNLTGYHTHTLNGQQGFMGGTTHQLAQSPPPPSQSLPPSQSAPVVVPPSPPTSTYSEY
tara:strand:- start:56 stop:307 length:252 start_codon:yes stop_codon:yes gene_type:complete